MEVKSKNYKYKLVLYIFIDMYVITNLVMNRHMLHAHKLLVMNHMVIFI